MGFPVPSTTTSFGPFINRNHAGVYLYLHVGLALALTFWHIRRAGNNALRGGPYLVSGFLACGLALCAGLTASMAAIAASVALALGGTALVYFFGFPSALAPQRAILRVTLFALVLIAAGLFAMADFSYVADRFKSKAAAYRKTGADDRAPLRRATWTLIADGAKSGRALVGYGAGSYCWISPPYQAQQKELQKDGRLFYRAIHAHNDWLEMLAEWGVLGLLPVLAALAWLGRQLVRAFHAGHPESVPLALGLLFLMLHAWVDLLVWFTPLMFTAGFVVAAMTCLTDQSSSEQSRDLT